MNPKAIPATIALLSLVALTPVAAADIVVQAPLHCVINDNPGSVYWFVEQASGGAVNFYRCGAIVDPDALPDVPAVGAPEVPEGLCDDVEFLLFEPNC